MFCLYVDDVKVIIAGDGSTWIRKCSSYWPDSTYILDKFHAVRKISHVFNLNNEMLKTVNEELKHLFNNGQYTEVMTLLNQKWFGDPNKSLKLRDLKSYFRSNEKDAKDITNQSNPYNIGCNIESTISYNVKWLLGYGSKAFNKETYSKILDIHIAKVNGVSIVELLKEKIINKVKERIYV